MLLTFTVVPGSCDDECRAPAGDEPRTHSRCSAMSAPAAWPGRFAWCAYTDLVAGALTGFAGV